MSPELFEQIELTVRVGTELCNCPAALPRSVFGTTSVGSNGIPDEGVNNACQMAEVMVGAAVRGDTEGAATSRCRAFAGVNHPEVPLVLADETGE